MAKLFSTQQQSNLTPRQALMSKYAIARGNLLLVLLFTVINLALVFFDGETYFLFSASIPYFLVFLGRLLCGKFPLEFYLKNYESTDLDFRPDSFLYAMVGIAVVILALYLLCWLFSKKQVGWLVAALVLFVVDTIGLFLFIGVSADSIFDLLFHAWVLYYLIVGIASYAKLKKLPPDPVPAAAAPTAEASAVPNDNEEQNG